MLEDEVIIHFKHWISTDRTTLEERTNPIAEFLEMLIQEIDQLTTHHYVARNQSNYLKHLKVTLEPKQAIIILDFAENYSFIVQDAIQGFHWNNSQATLHPFAVYYRDGDNEIFLFIYKRSIKILNSTRLSNTYKDLLLH